MTDLKKSLERGRRRTYTVVISGNADTTDYLGDTTADSGIPINEGSIVEADINTQTADSAGLEAAVHNETAGTSGIVSFTASGFDSQSLDLFFAEGDELAFEVTASGATPAADGQITLVQEVDLSPMN